MQSTTIPQPQSTPERTPERWHRVIGRVQRARHAEVRRQTGNAGAFVTFACGRTFSVADVAGAMLLDKKCAPCAKAIGAAR